MARNRFSDEIHKVARQQKITTQLFFQKIDSLNFTLGFQCSYYFFKAKGFNNYLLYRYI